MDKPTNIKFANALADYITANANKQYIDSLGKEAKSMIIDAALLIMSAPIKYRKVGFLISCYSNPAYVRIILQYTTDYYIHKHWTTVIPKLMKESTTKQTVKAYNEAIKSAFSKSLSPDTDIFDAALIAMKTSQKQPNDNLVRIAEQATQIANFRKHSETIHFPVLKILANNEKTPNLGTLFIRSNGKNVREGLVTDGPLRPGESFDDHIATVNRRAEKYDKQFSDKNSSKNISYIGDYDGYFYFKLYLQDTLVEKNNQTGVIRSINAFFVDPKYNDFYQLFLSNGPYVYNPEKLTPGKLDRENKADNNMRDAILSILSGVKRKQIK